MGLACPVCETPQRDAEHLANHLAFVAMLHADAHEDWLDERAPDWREDDPETLGDRVAPHAEPAEYEEVFEDTVHDHATPDPGRPAPTPPDDRTREVLAEARELTERLYAGAEADATDEGGDDADADPEA